jgi:Tfp pilus assembly protein PilX
MLNMQRKLIGKNKRIPKEQGFVAIIVAALIMIILSLITIGFTRIMQREQRQVIDRQLSRQAIYAAESGINDIYRGLQNNVNLPAEKTTCSVTDDVGGQPNPAVNGGVIDDNANVAYTCALYDKTPDVLNYSVATDESNVVELKPESGVAFGSLVFKWGNEESRDNDIDSLPQCGVNANVFPSSRPSNVPIIRLDLTNTSVLSRNSLIDNTDYLYFVPCRNGAPGMTTYVFLSGEQGKVVEVGCVESQDSPCEVTINGLNALSYVARIRTVYSSARLSISGVDVASNPVQFRQAQTSIDVTAKASDVVRRLRVSIPLTSANNPPEAVFQVFDGVCKLLSVDPNPVAPSVVDNCSY